jgi:hypothetical protein
VHPSLENLTFGAEFEVLLPRHFSQAGAAAELSRLIGEPVAARGSAALPGQWKVVTDGSLSGPGCVGLEFVSPILSGQAGLDNVVRVSNALRAMGATVNRTCGFHVHVGGHDRSLAFFRTLVKLYARYEDAIDSLMPPTRRENAAQYCRSVKLARDLDSATTVDHLGAMLARSSGAGAAKYHKVNVAPYGKPTVEFRHHAGTVDGVKAVNWIVTCLRMVRAAIEGKTGETGAVATRAVAWELARLSGKQLHCATMVARDEGATNAEIRAAYGLNVVSARRQLGEAGLTFRTARDRATGKDRFFAVVPTVNVGGNADAAFPTTLDGLAALLGSDADERAFFQGGATRVAALAAADLPPSN